MLKAKIETACTECALSRLCLPVALSEEDVALLEEIIDRPKPLSRGDYLYQAGDKFEALYVVRSGAVKTFAVDPGGTEQITGFYLPGELFGLSAINEPRQNASAQALERTNLCILPYAELDRLCGSVPSLARQIMKVMSDEIREDHALLTLVSKKRAESRLATFLLSIAQRLKKRKLPDDSFQLSMSRSDIGNYLGLAEETVSRMFTRFQEEGLVTVQRKQVELLDHERLQQVCDS
ncbi:MAG: transcriptional regulator FNR [Gammaproteobacteria bacterium]|nr:MAG: transcriptional regulator FNR [Gammaproteobacteria bacterium]RLA17335.1 MAG: transcriptional regulator FNR [Gammaproteobacteria bacterium]